MDIERAKDLLTALADGVNPITGELLPSYDSCNQAEIVRALHTAVATLEKAAKRASKPLPDNAGKPWTVEEEARLVASYRSGKNGAELAAEHNRTKVAIASRLVKLGIVSFKDEVK